jgi:hypothetical protein
MRPILAAVVLVLNAWAIADVFGSRRGTPARLGWTAAIVLVPLAGAVLWWAAGRTRTGERARRR